MRKRIGKTVVAVTLVGSMAVTPVFAAPAKENEKQTKESSVSDLQSELEQVMTKMADLETKLIAKGEEIQKASKELQQAEEKSAKQYEDMKLRIKYMYEAGDTELEKFINAESAGDALNKAEYVQAVYAACQKKDILFIVDEVQTGVGRTGTFYSYQQFGIQPDLVSSAKGLGGGLPIGAVLFGEKTQDTLIPGDHGSTFGGNPVVCAGAVEVLNRMDDTFLQNVTAKGRHMREEIEKMPHVTSVAGMGMMLGIELDIDVKPVVTALMENGLLVLTAKHKMRLLPPLNIAQTELEKGLSILKNTLAAL